MIGRVDMMITADLMDIAMDDRSAEPAPSPTIEVPMTMLRKNSMTGYWRLFK